MSAESPAEFRARIVRMLRAGRGETFDPETSEPVKSTRSPRRRSSGKSGSRRTIPSKRPHAGDDEGRAGAD